MRGNSTGRRGKLTARSAAAIVATALFLTAVFAPVSLAAAPTPTYGSATVDGATGDWSLGADLFANMTDAGDPDRDVRAKLYVRYDCDEETLYALVLAQGDEKVRQDRPDEAYVRIDGGGKLIDPDGDFAWVNGNGERADGWEGAGELAPGSYTLRAHVLVADDSADGYTPMDVIGRTVPLEIECGDVGPTQGTNNPPTNPPGNNTQPPGGGGVGPTTGTNTGRTLPPTDTVDGTATSQTGSAGLVVALIGLGALSVGLLTLSRGRRKPIVVEETIKTR